ncbi:putative UV-endonuclease UvdE [Lyophyllum shimeji]|uniref:UV-endonuclease UvdE n=1 Tax=Lyophyllum shimeji TaxID=47721 RepID=A0A9P3PL49_LYOSH|nr:putative UV-endonuclease UvdE [Lyophyllum shimeji]
MAAVRRSARLALVQNSPVHDTNVSPPQRPKRKKTSVAEDKESAPPSPSRGTGEAVISDDEYLEKSKSPRKKRRPKPEPVYVIPDVETKTTTFKGRLGYACLNTVLRNRKPASEAVFCSRTCRLESLKSNGLDWVKDIGRKNAEDLITMIQWNEDNHIRFLRVSSEMFPFASHAIHGYSLKYCAPILARAGALANQYGHRLTTHPGQYTQLGSPKPEVVQSSIRELSYHCEMLDRMGVGVDGVIIVHGGGVYEDKAATLARIKKVITEALPEDVRNRLALENDELCYNAEDLLPLCEELGVPLIFDYHHDALNPSSIPPKVIIERANAIFARRGIRPKQHLSEPRPGAVTLMERRAHADRCENLPVDLPDDMDLMIEAKDKEQAVLHLYRMYNLHSVNYASLRPPDPNQTKETKGRKSNKKARVKAEQLSVDREVREELAVISNGDCETEPTKVILGVDLQVHQETASVSSAT